MSGGIVSKPERVTRRGEVMLSHNHIALLHGLYDRPGGHARSGAEWVRAAAPYFRRFSWSEEDWPLRKSMKTINPAWVSQTRRGRFIQATLTERGRAIVERTIASRMLGFGSYEGLPPGNMEVRKQTMLPADLLVRIADYTTSFGIPLLDMTQAAAKGPTVYAVTTGIDRPFRIAGLPEIEGRGPRALHYKWAREIIGSGATPKGYLEFYHDEDPEDLTCYLKELLTEPEAYVSTYCKVYNGKAFLSEAMLNRWLNEDIDFAETDMEPGEAGSCLRAHGQAYVALHAALPGNSIRWTHPVSGKSLGSVQKIRVQIQDPGILTATSPAALSCLQAYLDTIDPRFSIETRYMPEGSRLVST